jgi:shikimate kinase
VPDGWHIALVGLPGAGKTTIGRRLARRLNRPFIDFDEEIVRRQGRAVTEIFAQEGEAFFRQLELDVTRDVATREAGVLSPGGGWVTRPETVGVIRHRTKLVWLKVSPERALERMGSRAAARPLLMKGAPIDVLRDLLDRRGGYYQGADAVVDTETLAPQEVVDQLAQLASLWEGPVG